MGRVYLRWGCCRGTELTGLIPPVSACYTSPLSAQAHLDGTLGLHKPASQHGLCVLMAQLRAGLENLLLHLGFQQQPAQPPVEEGACSLPLQHVLWTGPAKYSERREGTGNGQDHAPGWLPGLCPPHPISRDTVHRGPSSYLGRRRAGFCRTPWRLACSLKQTDVHIYLC